MAHAALLGLLLQVAVAAADGACPAPWGYAADNGPEAWGQMNPAWVKCETGRRQSPIDVNAARDDGSLPQLTVSYAKGTYPVVLQNTGHDIKVTPLFDGTVQGGGDMATLIQFHIHYPAEHAGLHSSAIGEIHLVHQLPSNGALIVLAVPVHEGKTANPAFTKLLALLPAKCRARKTVKPEEYVELGALLPNLAQYSFYSGSLTTPACDETVSWFVFSKGIEATRDQIALFRPYRDAKNARPLQPLLGREVTRRP